MLSPPGSLLSVPPVKHSLLLLSGLSLQPHRSWAPPFPSLCIRQSLRLPCSFNSNSPFSSQIKCLLLWEVPPDLPSACLGCYPSHPTLCTCPLDSNCQFACLCPILTWKLAVPGAQLRSGPLQVLRNCVLKKCVHSLSKARRRTIQGPLTVVWVLSILSSQTDRKTWLLVTK